MRRWPCELNATWVCQDAFKGTKQANETVKGPGLSQNLVNRLPTKILDIGQIILYETISLQHLIKMVSVCVNTVRKISI